MQRKKQHQALLLREEFEYNHEDNPWCQCPGPLTTNLVSLTPIIDTLLFLSLSVLLCLLGGCIYWQVCIFFPLGRAAGRKTGEKKKEAPRQARAPVQVNEPQTAELVRQKEMEIA